MGMKQGGVSWIQQGVVLVDLRKISIGRNFGCNSGSYINGVGTITIGNDVLIGTNVTISSGKHEIDGRECSVYSRPSKPVPITIGDDVWIGAGAVIMPGVKLASGTVVGANAVVVRDTEEYSVVVGVPARHIHFR
jgi:acetyltransferase-like isoleucine patch superfamily enzyme